MINTDRLIQFIEAFGEIDGCCQYCPAYDDCYVGADCTQVIYKWLNKENKNDC